MSRRRCQAEVDSAEFGDWLAFWQLEADQQGGETTPDQLAAKMATFAGSHPGTAERGSVLVRRK